MIKFHSPLAALAASFVSFAVLAGCATPSAPLSTAVVAPYQAAIELNGHLSVNYLKDGRRQAASVGFNWLQTANRTDVTLASPLGSTIAIITVAPGYASLTEAGKPPRVADDIDSLSAQTLGWTLPVSGLRDWLQGHAMAADGGPFAASPAHSSVTTRDGWQLDYVSWQDDGAAVPRPRRIDVARAAVGGLEDMQIRIVIDAPAAP
ncbi:outer membrane lipoprotein LolB [Duganella sp. FT3S]|uniref:Outer-membrane lipoprotein LolB n=1 Tax=Rugamonas fusca TaxID=2758568 RepID=A0A7W2I734_9BURK|nr:outer membrane lipoprotein LolB [Rugamonas fusca]MBA5606020.1 outer membrane lipoprotein LolB [Rugamonas fusca]